MIAQQLLNNFYRLASRLNNLWRGGITIAALFIFSIPSAANALIIKLKYDTSITSLANAAQVEGVLQSAANVLGSSLASPVTVNITASWGKVAGYSLNGNIGASIVSAYNGNLYSDIQSAYSTSAAANPTDKIFSDAAASLNAPDPTHGVDIYIPSAQAKVFGIIPGNSTATDGYIGFANTAWDYSNADGVALGTYDFQALAYHEIAEALGRVTGITSTLPSYFTIFDLFRYKASSVAALTYAGAAYFSANGGVTNNGTLNNLGGGDRSDWLSSGSFDDQVATFTTGRAYNFAANDWTVLDALGYNQVNGAYFYATSPPLPAVSLGELSGSVPEPSSWLMMALGTGFLGSALRLRSRPQARASVR